MEESIKSQKSIGVMIVDKKKKRNVREKENERWRRKRKKFVANKFVSRVVKDDRRIDSFG